MIKIYLIFLLMWLPIVTNADIDKADCLFGGIVAENTAIALQNHMPLKNRIEISNRAAISTSRSYPNENSKKYILHLQKIELIVINLVYSWNISDSNWAKKKFISECLVGKYLLIGVDNTF